MFPEPPEVLLCEVLLFFFPRDQSGNARFVERVTTDDSEIDAYLRYIIVVTQTRDAIKKLKSNEDVDKLLYMSDDSWDSLIEFVTSQIGYIPQRGGILTRDNKPLVLYKLFCIALHDNKLDSEKSAKMKNMQSYKSFVVLRNLCGKNIVELQASLVSLANIGRLEN
jgi:hypothetical protein